MTARPRGFLPETTLSVSPGNGPIAGYTTSYNLNLVNFDWVTWHNYEWENWVVVDALLTTALSGLLVRGAWKPNTAYAQNDVVVDTRTGDILISTIAHTSSEDLDADKAAGKWGDYDVSAGAVTVGPTPPLHPVQGDLWFATVEPVGLYVWYVDVNSAQWVQTNGGEGTPDLPITGGTLTGPLTVDGAQLKVVDSNIRIESTGPNILFAETDVVLPDGASRIQSAGGSLQFRFNTALAGDFSTYVETMRVSKTQVVFNLPITASGGITAASSSITGNATVGSATISNTSTILSFKETDQTAPNGQYRFIGSSASFAFQKALTDDFATVEDIWQYSLSADALNVKKPTVLTGAPGGTPMWSMKIDTSYPSIWFHDASATVENFLMTTGNSVIRFQTADSSGNPDEVLATISPDEVITYPRTKLSADDGTAEIGNSTIAQLHFQRQGSLNYIKVPSNANTSLRVENLAGTAWATINSASGWSAGCDARLKHNIVDISYGLDTVMALRAVEFDWNDDNRHDIGLLAQEVQPLIPEIIGNMGAEVGETDYLTLRKDALVAVLIKAVQELTLRVQELEAR